MNIYLKEFREAWNSISKTVNLLEDAFINSDRHYIDNDYQRTSITFRFSKCTFSSFENMSEFTQKVDSIHLGSHEHAGKLSFAHDGLYSFLSSAFRNEENITLSSIQDDNCKFKLSDKFFVKTIQEIPFEVVHGDRTYRILTGREDTEISIQLASSDQDAVYNYLDKGHYIKFLKTASGRKIIVTDNYTQHAAKIFALCEINPGFIDMLQDGCFIDSNTAQIMCLKMEKKLEGEQKHVYNTTKTEVEKAYVGSIKNDTIKKFINKETDRLQLNDITFTRNSATYQNVSIKAEDLIERITTALTDEEVDIYTVIDRYACFVHSAVDHIFFPPHEDKTIASFNVNGMPICVHIKKNNNLRYINNICVYKDDIGKILARSSCYRDIKQYNLFLKSVSRRSLQDHDIVANGFRVKIHWMSNEEYRGHTPRETAPALRFAIDPASNKIKLEISENRLVSVNFRKLIPRLQSINARTNNKLLSKTAEIGNLIYSRKDCEWARACVIQAILNTKDTLETITTEDLNTLLVNISKTTNTAVEKSKEFLESAIKVTGAEKIMFKSQEAYKVKGSLREYVVIKSSAKVYDYDTGQYRCVVNDAHYVGAGYDDIAARLLMLKNDSVLQRKVTTLQGAAQPHYEHHYNYAPDRGGEEDYSAIVSGFLPA